MKRTPAGFALALMTLVAAALPSAAAEHVPAPPTDYPSAEQFPAQSIASVPRLDVDVWINKDEGGIYRPGESMRVYFRASSDGYGLVFNVDTDGYVHLIYPYGPEDHPYVEGGRTYRIPSRSDPYDLVADGPPGIEYVVAVASPYPFQNLPWYLSADRADGGRPDIAAEDSGDDTDSGRLVGDPYVGIDRIIRRIAPPGREDRIATNETYFYIDRRVEYPRYVCADCHYHPFYFDPYVNACSVFEIRVDATWAHYAPIRYGAVRPRYIYRVRPEAPVRYRQWKSQWSSLDGKSALRTRFLPERDIRYRREHAPRARLERPELRDLRRYREGRIWQGRDEILRLRERRDQSGGPQSPPEDRGARQRGERRSPDNPGDRQRERPQPPEDRSGGASAQPREVRPQPREEHAQPREERGSRERPAPQRENRGKQEKQDRGDRNRGDKDRGDRGR